MKQAMIDYVKNGPYDEFMTPAYAVYPIMQFIPRHYTVWCPFDKEDSNYVKLFTENGYSVIYSHKDENKDFFHYQPEHFDVIVSNPPFSIKNQILKRCYELGKPFALLLPITTIEGVERHKLFRKHGIQLLVFDRRIGYTHKGSHWVNTSYFCWKLLPQDLMFWELKL